MEVCVVVVVFILIFFSFVETQKNASAVESQGHVYQISGSWDVPSSRGPWVLHY